MGGRQLLKVKITGRNQASGRLGKKKCRVISDPASVIPELNGVNSDRVCFGSEELLVLRIFDIINRRKPKLPFSIKLKFSLHLEKGEFAYTNAS